MLTGYFQFDVRYGDPAFNAAAIAGAVEKQRGPGLLVLPELAFSGYDFPDAAAAAALAEPFGEGAASSLLLRLAKETELVLVAGYAERAEGLLYNSALVVEPDGTMHNYRKLHLFNRETTLFTPGDAAPAAIETCLGPIGVMICFDWFYPEVARCLALDGAQVIAHPSNLVLPWCQRAMFARSVENRVYTVTANRIGTETQGGRTMGFTGCSQVLSPLGEALASAPPDASALALVDVPWEAAADKQLNPYNNLFEDRRVDCFARLTQTGA